MTQLCNLDHEHKHGTRITCYRNGKCRCQPCRDLCNKRKSAERRAIAYGTYEGMSDATGSRRRIQALNRMGWSDVTIAALIGEGHGWVWSVKFRKRVMPTTRQKVADAYEALSGRLPGAEYSSITANLAAHNGWPPPLAWGNIDDDPEPADTGKQSRLMGDELITEIEWLVQAGTPAHEIASTLGKSRDVLERFAWRYKRNDLATYLRERSAA